MNGQEAKQIAQLLSFYVRMLATSVGERDSTSVKTRVQNAA
jgi:hypothetical protein